MIDMLEHAVRPPSAGLALRLELLVGSDSVLLMDEGSSQIDMLLMQRPSHARHRDPPCARIADRIDSVKVKPRVMLDQHASVNMQQLCIHCQSAPSVASKAARPGKPRPRSPLPLV